MLRKRMNRMIAVSLTAATILSNLGSLPALASADLPETVLETSAETVTETVRETKSETESESEAETKAKSRSEEKIGTKSSRVETKDEENAPPSTEESKGMQEEEEEDEELPLSYEESNDVNYEGNEKAGETIFTEPETEQTVSAPDTEVEVDAESDTASMTEQETSNDSEGSFSFPEVKDTSVLKGLDFSSKRLIVVSEKDIIKDTEHLLSSYDGISLLQYETESEAKRAYAWYLSRAELVDVDIPFYAASGSHEFTGDTLTMTEEYNPVAMLEEISEDASNVKGNDVIALIDSGMSKGSGAIDRVSVLDSDPDDDFGHGDQMAAFMKDIDPDARILSIKALDENGQGTASSVYAAIRYAIDRRVKVINLSMSAYSKADNACIKDAIHEAVSRGILVTGSAGNHGRNVKYFVPGSADEAIIAGACDETGIRIARSNFGDTVDYLVNAGTTSEASAKLAAWLAAHADAKTWAADIDTVIDRHGLIFTADAEGQDLPVPEGDGTFSADASVKLTSSEYLRKIYYNHIGAAFKFDYKGTSYQGVCAHDLIPAIPSKGSNLTIDYHKTITLKDKGSWYYTYAKIVYNAFYSETQYDKMFAKYSPHRKNDDLTKKDSRIYFTGLAMSYAQGHVYKDKDAIKHMIYNSDYGYDIKGDGAGLGKKIYNWVKNNGVDLPANITVDIIWAYPSSNSRQPVIGFDVTKTPTANLVKSAVSEAGAAMNVVPSGAVYTIYSDADCKSKVVSLTVEDDGKSEKIPSSYFSAGKTYYAKETKAPTADPPEGYEWVMDTQVHEIRWDLKDDLTLKYANTLKPLPPSEPDKAPVGIRKITKAGMEELVKGNNQYSLAGAVYGVWTDDSCSGEPVTRATTSSSGMAVFNRNFDVGSTVYIKEISPSKGYELNTQIHKVTVAEETASNMVNNRVTSQETPASGSFELKKKSAAVNDPNTSFEGAIFRVSFYPNGSWSGTAAKNWYFITKGNLIRYDKQYLAPGYTSDALFTDASGKASLPAGTLTVTELKAPEGYVTWSGTLKCAMVYNESSHKVAPVWTGSSYLEAGSVYSFKNTPAFGGIQFAKVDKETRKPLKGAVIAIYNRSERDVLINESGTYKTVKDKALATTVTTDENGIARTVANLLGTGSYYAVEQTPPFSYIKNTAWKKEFTITSAQNGKIIDATDEPLEDKKIILHTTAKTQELDEASVYEKADDGKRTFKDIQITDTLSYENLPEGTYLIRGILMDKKTGKELTTPEGKTFTAYTVLTAKKSAGNAVVTFRITKEDLASFDKKDGSNVLEGSSLVVFERLYSLKKEDADQAEVKPNDYAKDQDLVAVHEDIKDASQDIRFPAMQTHANDGIGETLADTDHGISELGRHEVLASDQMVITDRVTYKNLHGDAEYVITGTLHFADGSQVKDDEGNPVTASETIKTKGKYDDNVSGFVDLTFGPFSGLNLAGSTIVAFETAEREGKVIMVHADIEDAPQTIYIPAIHTNASGTGTLADMHEARAVQDGGISDTVSYENLKPGQDYLVKGRLVYREDYPEEGIKAGDPVIANGTEVTAERAFTADGKVEEPVVQPEDVIPAQPEDPAGEAAEPSETESAAPETEETEDFSDLTDTDETELYEDGDTSDVEDLNDYSDLADEEEPDDESEEESEDESQEEAVQTEDVLGTDEKPSQEPQTEVKDPGIDMDEAQKELTRTGRYTGVSGSVVVFFAFDTTSLQGKNVVVFEELYTVSADSEKEDTDPETESASETETESENGTSADKLVAVHRDIEDVFQTVNIPKIETTASDSLTGAHETQTREETILTDTVKVTNLQVGRTYLLNGILMNKKTGEALLAGGTEVTASKEFSYDDIKDQEDTVLSEDEKYFSGTVTMIFTFDSSALTGETIVAFEKLYRESIPVAAHEDISDEDQSVDIVDIHTKAVNPDTGTQEVQAGKETNLTDSVQLHNLKIGEEYSLKTHLMDKNTGDEITKDGESIVSETTFSYEDVKADNRCQLHDDQIHYDAVMDVDALFDTSDLAGHTLVFFEELHHGEAKIAVHEDISDEGQSIDILDIRTSASDKTTGTHEGQADEKTVITDRVSLTHLLTGKTYKVSGVLMNKKTGKPLQADGKQITAEKIFTYEDLKDEKTTVLSEDGSHFDGEIILEFPVDTSSLAGRTIVVFEKLYKEDIQLAVHEDLEDEEQSVHVVDLKTLALDKKSGTHTMALSKKAVIADTVTYTGLTAGKKYTVSGTVMDKSAKKPVKAVCRPVTFTVKDSEESDGSQVSGQVQVEFELNTESLQGKELVVFETLKDEKGNVIAKHEDIDDQKQTVTVPEKEEEETRQTVNKKGSSYTDEETPSEETPAKESVSSRTQNRLAVKTGAWFNLALWGGLFTASIAILTILIRKRKG